MLAGSGSAIRTPKGMVVTCTRVDVLGGEAWARRSRERVQREVVVSAAGVELEVVLLDAVAVAEPCDDQLRLEAVGEDGAVHVGRSVVEPGEAAALELDRRECPERPSGPG